MSPTIKGIQYLQPLRPIRSEHEDGTKELNFDGDDSFGQIYRTSLKPQGGRYEDGRIDEILHGHAVIGAKMQIVHGLNPNHAEVQTPGENADLQGNLKEIVADDRRWANFCMGILGKSADFETMQPLRQQLTDGFDQGVDLEDMTNWISGYAADPSDQDNIERRIDLWLNNPEFFDQLTEAIQNKDLESKPELFTNPLIFSYIDTFRE